MLYTRRELGKLALAALPASRALAAPRIDSKFGGVQIGVITYSLRTLATPDPQAIIDACVEIGLGEVELMSDHCEALAGAPRAAGRAGGGAATPAPPAAPQGAGGIQRSGGGRGQGGVRALSAEQQSARDKLAAWRADATPATWQAVTRKFNDAGIDVALLCYNMNDNMQDEDIEYGFKMAEGLGAKALSTSTTLSMAKRIAPIADKHKLPIGYHGHDATDDPNQTATLESYYTLMAYGRYNGINLDIGHFTAAGYDAVDFIEKYHDKITNLHIKDRKKDHGPNVEWGKGDTPLKEVLLLCKKNKYPFPANIEREYPVPEGSNLIAEFKKCLAYARNILV